MDLNFIDDLIAQYQELRRLAALGAKAPRYGIRISPEAAAILRKARARFRPRRRRAVTIKRRYG